MVLERGLCLAVALVVAVTAVADEDLSENVFLPADRHTLQKLADSRKLLAEGRLGEAVRYLGAILEGPEDFFFQPDKASPIHRSLKAEAQRLIGQMPSEGRELYELQYGARARRMLEEALEAGDATSLAEVSRRFFHTRSGYQATFLLGLHHFDHGRPLAGALTLQRLREAGPYAEEMEPALALTTAACWLQAGMSEKARESLVSLRQRHPVLRVAVAGREVPIFSNDAEAVDWLVGLIGTSTPAGPAEADHWWMFRGDAARNATAVGGTPLLNMRWRVAVTDDPLLETALEQYQRQCTEQGAPIILAMHPLAVADVLLMRTARNLLAVDFSTGKRLWEVPEEDDAESAIGVSAADLQMRQPMLRDGMGQRMWGDMTYGTLSSDGRCVFSIEDLDLGFGPAAAMLFRLGPVVGRKPVIAGDMTGEQTSLSNRLAAYEVRTGKLKWQIGGPAGPHALRQAETFFLGPPLPLLGQLYVLGEIKGEVRLMALDGATGDLLWSQQLAVVEQSVLQDPLRRWAGASPSYADGVLVCPTSTGAIVGVELATRWLLWGYRYGRGRAGNRSNLGLFSSVAPGGAAPSRWIDGSVTIADGRVLATPIESDSLYCLSLIDGALLWKSPRQNDLYVACADRDKVVLVGRRAVRALRITDGKPAWDGRTVDLPENSAPSGRGFLSNDRYFLPLSSAEVVGIDLGEGKIAHVAKSRSETVPGNLICYRGKVISQGLEGVDAYSQLDAVIAEVQRRLAANPNDAEALSLRGETLLEAGKRSEAVASFRRAYELEPDPRTRELLRDSLLEGLRTEFAAYRQYGGEVERLVDDPAGHAVYLRLMACGLRQAGQWATAFEYYQKLIDLEPNQRPLDPIGKNLTVLRDRWFQGQLVLLRSEASDEAAAKIDAVVDARLKAAIAAGSIDALERFLDYFGNQPAAAPARSELVRRLNGAGRLLEAELTAGCETASGGQSRQDASWPVGKIEIARTTTKNSSDNGYGRYAIELYGSSKPFFSDVSIRFDDARHTIVGSDGWGRQRWQVSLAGDGPRQNFGYNRAWTQARAQGHLLLLTLGWKILAIDTLGSGRNGEPRLLWTEDLIRSGVDPVGLRALPLAMPNLPWQWQRQLVQSYDSLLGPVTGQYVCFQRFRNLVAVDPQNGQTLWVRRDVPPGSDLFGDDQYVFVLSPDREEATLLRALDGERLGTRKVPRLSGRQVLPNGEKKTVFAHLDDFCLATLGRRLLLWWPEGNQRVLTLVDPLEGRDVWPGRQFSAAACTCVVGEEAVGVLEPNGRFVLLGLPDGRTIADIQLEPEPSLTDITLLATGGQYFLLTRSSVNDPAPIQAMPGCAPKPIHRGRLYAIDEQGKLQWPKPATIKNQFLLLEQPSRLPVLSFACQVYQQQLNGQGQQKMSLLLIDKRNGRIAYQKKFTNSAGILDIAGDAETKTVTLTMQRDTVRLKFTDKPAKSPQGGNAARALWNSMQTMLGRLIEEPGQE